MDDFDALTAAGMCECGQSLKGHPTLPKPLPMSHGRPCGKTQDERAYGWDGRPRNTTEAQHSWGRDGKYSSPKAHEPTRGQQVTITSKATQMARAK